MIKAVKNLIISTNRSRYKYYKRAGGIVLSLNSSRKRYVSIELDTTIFTGKL